MITFENITLRVHQQTLLERATLHLAPGDKVVVRGASGCGKSSLLKCAAGALPLAEGSVAIDGLKLTAATVAELRARMAFVGQEPVLGATSVREALLLPFSFKAHRGRAPTPDKIHQLLAELHLSADLLDQPCQRISGGEKQRMAILRALLLNKTIFLADEVTSALDPQSRAAVMAALFRPEITLLSVSHDPEWTAACERRIDLSNLHLIEEQI